MRTPVHDRRREIARIRRLLERLHTPRLQMMLIVALTGAAGLLSSFVLLHAGVETLWLRYMVAVAMAYGAFLCLLWFWLRRSMGDLLEALEVHTSGGPEIPDVMLEPGGGEFGGAGASDSFPGSSEPGVDVDAANVPDADDLGVVLAAIVALVFAAVAALWVIWSAPALFAELLLDVGLAAGLYRRLRGVRGEYWLRTAMRRTAGPFLAVAVVFAVAGAVMQALAPEARSLGEVIRYYRATSP